MTTSFSLDLDEAAAAVADPALLAPGIAPLLVRLGDAPEGEATLQVALRTSAKGRPRMTRLTIRWSTSRLATLRPGLVEEIASYRRGTHLSVERTTELAAYALAICGVRAFLPGRTVTRMNPCRTPDFFLDEEGERGIEVAGRTGEARHVRTAVTKKRNALRLRDDLTEAHLSVWGLTTRTGHQERVK